MNTQELLEFLKYNGAERAGACGDAGRLFRREDSAKGLVILVRLPVRIAGYLRSGPYQQYLAACDRMDHNLAEVIRAGIRELSRNGYRAEGRMAKVPQDMQGADILEEDRYLIDCAAAAAGLGWIGRNGRLVVRDFGPVVRSAVILTDAPLENTGPETESHCGACRVCIGNCPAGALTGKAWNPGCAEADLINRGSCDAFCAEGVCEKCAGVCTYTQKYMRNAKWY